MAPGIPGVSIFALSDSMPPAGGIHGRPYSNMRAAGRPPLPSQGGMVAFRYVSPPYFQALNIRLISGRTFNEADRSAAQDFRKRECCRAADCAAGLHWGTDNLPIVGVAADVKNSGLAAPPEPEY